VEQAQLPQGMTPRRASGQLFANLSFEVEASFD
jgi:hypothetical protein